MNKEGRNHFSVEGVRLFCAADDRSEGHILVIIEKVSNECGFASAPASDKNHYGILGDTFHVESFDIEIYMRAG